MIDFIINIMAIHPLVAWGVVFALALFLSVAVVILFVWIVSHD